LEYIWEFHLKFNIQRKAKSPKAMPSELWHSKIDRNDKAYMHPRAFKKEYSGHALANEEGARILA
jgi:hypothetical protein